MQNLMSNTMTPLARSSSKMKGQDRSSSNLRSPPQLGQSSSAASLINYRISQSALAKGLGSQTRLRLDKENDVQRKQRDISSDTLQKRLDTFFASTRNFIYSATKMKTSMVEVIKDVDQQIDFNIKLFETDKQSLERSLNSLESKLFNLKDFSDLNFRSTATNFDRSKTALFNRQQDVLSSTQNLTESHHLQQLRRENRNLKYEMQSLKEEIDKVHIEKMSALKSQDHLLVSELEALQKQVTKIEKKASERKVCIKKLYSILENKEKELEEFKNYQQKYPLGAVVNMISQIKKYDSSKKMQSYIEMAIKEVKLNKLLQKEGDSLSKQKKVEIEEMIHFLKIEEKEIIKYFANLVSGNTNQKIERQTSPPPVQHNLNIINTGLNSPNNQQQEFGNIGAMSSIQFIRSNGFSQQQQQQSRDGSAFASPTNTKSQLISSSNNFNRHDKLTSSQQRLQPISPTNKQNSASLGQGFSNNDFEYVLKEQVEYVRKKYLTHFVEMLSQLNIHVDNLRLENQNDEAAIILKLRDEFSKIASKHTGYQTLVQELRQRIEQKEQEIKESHNEIENLKVSIIKVEEKAENNPKIIKLEEQVQQFKQEVKSRNEEKRQIQIRINQLEDNQVENERRERLYLEDIDRLKDELFMVLDNLKSIVEFYGIIDFNEERNVERMLEGLREYFNKQADKVYLHKNVFEDMEKKIIENQEEIENLKYQNGELAKQIDDLDEINRSLKDQIEIQTLKNQEGENLEQGIRDKIIQLQNENHILKKNQIDPEQLEKLQQEKRDSVNQLNERNEVIINMKIEIQNLEQRIAEKDKQIKKISSDLVNVEGEKTHQAKLVKSLEQFQVDKKARNEEILEKVIEMEKIQKKLNKRNLELEEEIKKYKEIEIKLEVQGEKFKKQGDDKSQEYLKKIKDLEKANQISNKKIGEQKEHIASLEGQISNLQRDLQLEKEQQQKLLQEIKKNNEKELAQVEFSQQKQMQQIQNEKEEAINAERQRYEREIQAIRRQDESEEYINQENYQKLQQELEDKDQQIVSLQQQLSDMQAEIQASREQINLERQKEILETQEQFQQLGVEAEKRIEAEKQKVADQFEKLLKEQAAQFNLEKIQQNEAFEKEFKQIESKYKEREEDISRENKRTIEVVQMELNGFKESNEEIQEILEKTRVELKQSLSRESDLNNQIESLKTKIEVIESNTSAENKTIVNGLQTEKRQLEQSISQLKRNVEQQEQHILELNQKIQKLQEENESISLERSNLIRELQANKEQASLIKQEDDHQVQELQQNIFQKTYYIQELVNEVANLKSKIEQMNEETKIITQESIQLNHKISELQQQNQEIEKRIELMSKKAEEAINQLKKEHQKQLEEVIHQSKGEIVESFKQQRIVLEQQINSLNLQNEQLKQQYEQQIKAIEIQKEQQKAEFEQQKEQQKVAFEQQNENQRVQYEQQKENQKTLFEQQIASLNDKINQQTKKHEASINGLNQEYTVKLQNAINQAKNEATQAYKPQIVSQEQQINQLNQETDSLKQNITELLNNAKLSESQSVETIQQLKKEHQLKLDEAIQKARNETSESYRQQISTLERQISVIKETQSSNTQTQTTKLTQEINTLNQLIITLQQEKSSLVQSNTEFESLIEQLRQNIMDLEEKIVKLSYSNEILQRKLKESEAKCEQLLANSGQEQKKESARLSQLQQEKDNLVSENNLLGNQIKDLLKQIEQYQDQHEKLNSQNQDSGRLTHLQQENDNLVLQNNQFADQINQLHSQIQSLGDQLLRQGGKQVNTDNLQGDDEFDFEDFADDLAASQNVKDRSRQDREKRSENAPAPIGGTGFKLNFANINSNFDDDADRMHIKRDLGAQQPGQQQSAHNKDFNNDYLDDDDFEDSAQAKSKFKDQIIQEQGNTIERQKIEVDDLKKQIDMMFDDINQQRDYIQYLEGIVDEMKQREQQPESELSEKQSPNQIKLLQQNQQNEDGSVSPNMKILTLKSKLADVQENHETETMNLNEQIIKLKEENKGLKAQISELILANEDLELRLEEKDNQILELQDNQHGDAAEEQIGQLHEQNEKLKQKVRRNEEDLAYIQQVNQNLNKQLDEYQKKFKGKQPGSESGQSKDDEEYEGGLVQQLGKTQQQQQQQQQQQEQQKKEQQNQMQQIGSYNEMQDQDFENDQDEEVLDALKPKVMNTEEAEQFEARLIYEKIQLQQQIAELKNDYGTIQTEDQIQIQELQKRLDINKKQFQLLQERSSKTQQQKHENAQLKQKYLHLQQQFKELKEEKEHMSLEFQSLKAQVANRTTSPQNNSKKGEISAPSVTLTEQIDMLKLSLTDSQSQLKQLKAKYAQGIKKIKACLEAPSFSATQPAETEEDIAILADQLVSSHQQRIQQMQIQIQHTLSEGLSTHKSPGALQDIENEEGEGKRKATDITSLKAYILYSQKLEAIIEEALLNKILNTNDQQNRRDLTSEQYEKVQRYMSVLSDFQVSLQEKEKEYLEMSEKLFILAEENDKLKRPDSSSNRNFLEKRKRKSQQQDPFQINDFENIKEEIPNPDNNDNNESSFISMSEQIIKELEGANTKTPQNQISMQQQSHLQKQHEEDMNKVMKENSELKASKEYFASRQDELYDELRAKEEIIQNNEQYVKQLKKEIRKLKESTEAISQKEQLKTIFIKFIQALSDKKKQLEADNFLAILFSMLGVTDKDKEDILDSLAKKPTDKKKSITQLLLQK